MAAVTLYNQLQTAGKLGTPGPDKCMSGFRGVGYDKTDRAWFCWWSEAGVKRYRVFSIAEFGFDAAFRAAVSTRQEKLKDNFQFVMQRNRWRSGRIPMGTART
jgi:hypothetical protein